MNTAPAIRSCRHTVPLPDGPFALPSSSAGVPRCQDGFELKAMTVAPLLPAVILVPIAGPRRHPAEEALGVPSRSPWKGEPAVNDFVRMQYSHHQV
jgi:hypothetical protein